MESLKPAINDLLFRFLPGHTTLDQMESIALEIYDKIADSWSSSEESLNETARYYAEGLRPSSDVPPTAIYCVQCAFPLSLNPFYEGEPGTDYYCEFKDCPSKGAVTSNFLSELPEKTKEPFV